MVLIIFRFFYLTFPTTYITAQKTPVGGAKQLTESAALFFGAGFKN